MSNGVLYRHSIRVFNWTEHTADGCAVSIEQNRFIRTCTHASIIGVQYCKTYRQEEDKQKQRQT